MSVLNEKRTALWALAISSAAVFMITLDNLVVSTALPVIREDRDPIFIAPLAGAAATKTGERPLLIAGLGLLALSIAWLGFVSTPDAAYTTILPALLVGGIGSSLFWAPAASIVLSAVKPEEEGIASGANNSIRELGGVFGLAILTTIFSAHGSFASSQAFVDGMQPAFYVGAAILAVATLAAVALPRRQRASAALEPALAA
jgi:MFS family permease